MDQMENKKGDDFFKNRKVVIRKVKGMRSYDDSPFLKKKLEEAYKALEENPIPEWLIKRLKED
jgi:hypothetical protein